jgi:hypothetical protein
LRHPGQDVMAFAGRWDARLSRYGTALLTDDPMTVIARVATTCTLYIGGLIPARLFNGVRMR